MGKKSSESFSTDYAILYQLTGKPVVKIGIGFSQETKNVSEWTN